MMRCDRIHWWNVHSIYWSSLRNLWALFLFFNYLILLFFNNISFQLSNLSVLDSYILLKPSWRISWTSPYFVFISILNLIGITSYNVRFSESFIPIATILIVLFYLPCLVCIIIEEVIFFVMSLCPEMLINLIWV